MRSQVSMITAFVCGCAFTAALLVHCGSAILRTTSGSLLGRISS